MSTKLGEGSDLNSTTSQILSAHYVTDVMSGTGERHGASAVLCLLTFFDGTGGSQMACF